MYLNDLILNVLLRLNMPRARFLFQNTPLSFDFSLADFDDFVAECCCDFFKRLVSRFSIYEVSIQVDFRASLLGTQTGDRWTAKPLACRVRVGVMSNSREVEVGDDQEK